MADVSDKITDVRNAARPNSARVTVERVSAGTTLQCNSLTGWPTASKVHFVTYQIDTNNDPVPGTQLDCSGIVSGANITSLQVIDGTDGGNSVGDVVEMLPTAAWGQDLVDALLAEHDREGLHLLPETALDLADNTTKNATTGRHGFLKKLDNSTANFMRGDGTWSDPWQSQWNHMIMGDKAFAEIQGTFTPFSGSGWVVGYWRSNSNSPGINDEIQYRFGLAAGTWNILTWFMQRSSSGICTISLDGADISSGGVDLYNGSNAQLKNTISNVIVSSSGVHTLNYKVASKNVSSSNYAMDIQLINLVRQA